MAAQADTEKAKELEILVVHQSTKVTTEVLDELRELVENGTVKPQVGKTFPLSRTKEAFAARESETVGGKVIVTMQ
jgi:NADPH:quinone reductase-like Zn-dependent oxidoreductase